MSDERFSRRGTHVPSVDPAERKFAAKRHNELLKEPAAYIRDGALSVLVFGVVRISFDSASEGTARTVAVSLVLSMAIEGANLYLMRRMYRREE